MNHPNRHRTGAAALAIVLAAPFAHAEDAKPEHQLSYNLSGVSEYRYRAISQSRLDPALQGGADYTHNPTGLYLGTWLSTIKWISDIGGDAHVEWDIYGGKRGKVTEDVSYDVGGLYYYYPSNGLGPNANTFELYGQLSYGPAYAKYSVSTTNLFGTPDSRHSGYFDVGANVDLPLGLVLNLHVGHQTVSDHSALSYTDYKVGLSQDLGVCTLAVAVIKADTSAYKSPTGENLGKSAAVFSVTKTF